MRVLLTGHRGYIGTVLSPMLLRAGHEVVGLDSDLYSRCTLAEGGAMSDVPTILKDTRDVEISDIRGFDAVLHLAALSNDPLGDLKPSLTDDINHRASVRIAELAKEAGVYNFISDDVAGFAPGPYWHYAISRKLIDVLVQKRE